MKNETKYSMLMVDAGGADRGPMFWVIYPTGGSYYKDEICRLPGGSEFNEDAANTVLNAMNT